MSGLNLWRRHGGVGQSELKLLFFDLVSVEVLILGSVSFEILLVVPGHVEAITFWFLLVLKLLFLVLVCVELMVFRVSQCRSYCVCGLSVSN